MAHLIRLTSIDPKVPYKKCTIISQLKCKTKHLNQKLVHSEFLQGSHVARTRVNHFVALTHVTCINHSCHPYHSCHSLSLMWLVSLVSRRATYDTSIAK